MERLIYVPRRPWGIALDIAGGKIYWTDYLGKKLKYANIDGSDEEILATSTTYLADVELDLTNDKIYWADYQGKKIRWADLDGGNAQTLLTTGTALPRGIGLDMENEKIYWTEILGNSVNCANLDGTDPQELIAGLTVPSDIVLYIPGAAPAPIGGFAKETQPAGIATPTAYSVMNYPNPFNPTTTIAYELPEAGQVDLRIYDITGKLVKTLVDDEKEIGYHTVIWSGKDEREQAVSSGVYFYRIKAGEYTETKRCLLVK